MEKKFEVPYNFSKKLLSFYCNNRDRISFLFIPSYKDDYANTRSSIETHRKGSCYMPNTRMEYESHLRAISFSGLKFVILLQMPNAVLTKETIEYYKYLGAVGFIIGNDDNAQIIKEYDSNLLVIASLVQRICHDAFIRDFNYYDYILLYYPFNRGLRALQQLNRIKDKVIIMPNTLCHVNCPSIHHWFPTRPFKQQRDCPILKDITKCGFISPEDLYLFDDFVAGYKIQGREYTTDVIIYICSIYFDRKSSSEFIDAMMGEDLATSFNLNKEKMSLSEYYNINSDEIQNPNYRHSYVVIS